MEIENQIRKTAQSHVFRSAAACVPQLLAAAVTALLHLWKRSTLLSIAGGTLCCMLLTQFVF